MTASLVFDEARPATEQTVAHELDLAQTLGEAQAAQVAAHGEEMLGLVGSAEDLSDAGLGADDVAVAGIGTDTQPPFVSPQP